MAGRNNSKYGTPVAELGKRGRYRVRVIQMDDGSEKIDIREFVESDRFTGFSQKGVRLSKADFLAIAGDVATREDSADANAA
jgi:hypothetical protein